MATLVASPFRSRESSQTARRGFALLLITGWAALSAALHGYHPYAEDGGLYLPEIRRLLDPSMYPHDAEFVTGHLRGSLFSAMVAGLVRGSHLSLEMVLLLLYGTSLWVTLGAAWLLAAQCFRSNEARCGAVGLLAAWMTMPVAGTSLLLMDPYVTARSLSTPCTLLALVGALNWMLPEAREGTDREWATRWWGVALLLAALGMAAAMHPLMAAYGLGCVLVLVGFLAGRSQLQGGGCLAVGVVGLSVAVGTAALVQGLTPAEGAAYLQVAVTRQYWFLSEWRWFEWVGLAAPLLILAVVAWEARREDREDHLSRRMAARDPVSRAALARAALARTAVVSGLAAVVVALLFTHVGSATHAVARLQPLRIFQTVYVVMILMVGAAVGTHLLKRHRLRWVAACVVLGGSMLGAERQTYAHSDHMELPWSVPRNPWEQALVWISKNTSKDALFALDPDYITTPGEDAQGFRAIAGRSALPDAIKDGGAAANRPALTTAWIAAQAAQAKLNTKTDAERRVALRPLGVTWVVLDRRAVTGFDCGYANAVVKVCRLP